MAKNNSGIMDVIRCDQKEYLVWKWHPSKAEEGENNREDSIRWGSPLRVKDGEVAVFVYSNKNESVQEYIEGPADCILSTENLPILSNVVGLAYGGGTPFPAEVYFINLAQIIQQKFVVPYFDVFDPRFTDFGVPTAVRGTITFKITDYVQFIKLHRLISFSLDDFNNQVKDAVSRYVKSTIANAPSDYNIPVVQLERRIEDINKLVEDNIKTRFFDDFGVTVTTIDVASIDIDKTSEGYIELKKVTKDLTTETMQAQAQVNIKDMKAQQKLGVFEKAANMFVDIKENQFARHKKTEKEYSDVIEDKRAGQAGAVIGKIFRTVRGDKSQESDVPPTIPPTKMYHVAVDGEATGPFTVETLASMANNKQLTKDSLVWTKGMSEWQKANTVDDLKDLFIDMPEIPQL